MAQWSVSGSYPRTLPTNVAYAKNHADTLTGRMFYFKYPKWYMRGEIISLSTPVDTAYFVAGVGVVTVSYATIYCKWFNTSTDTYWFWTGTAWRNSATIDIGNLMDLRDSVNNWNKKNTFKDSLIANMGIRSGGLIDTKGIKTSGTSTKAGTENNGVQKDAVVELTASASLDGTYNTILCNPSSADIVLTLPAITGENAGWKYNISKKQSSSYNVRLSASGFNHVIISPDAPIVIRQRNGTWVTE